MTFSPVAWRYKDPLTSAKLDQMVDNVNDHDHRNDGSQGKALGVWAAGDGNESRSATGWVSTVVTLPAGRFSTAPDVIVEAGVNGVNADVIEGIEVSGISTTQFTVSIYRTNTTNTAFRWTATGRR